MSDALETKRQALEAFLREMEALDDAVRDGRFDELDEALARQEVIVREIEALDRESNFREQGVGSREQIEKLKALVARITEINQRLIAAISKEAASVQRELNTLHRGAEATAGYRKQANVKI